MATEPTIQRIGIIGAGASGIAAAKAFLAEKCFRTIEILEQRGETGGVWNYTPERDAVPVPSTDPNSLEIPVWSGGQPVFISAMYDQLGMFDDTETNVPKQLMQFDGFPFPDNLPLFPPHGEVRRYLKEYGKDVQHLITFNAKVIDCRKRGMEWEVSFKDIRNQFSEGKRVYDAVLVAVGHYNIPYIPQFPGLKEWDETFQGSISHSKYFRRAECFSGEQMQRGKSTHIDLSTRNMRRDMDYFTVLFCAACVEKVIVVGNSVSGIDIAAQICQFSQRPLIQSCRKSSFLRAGLNTTEIREVPEIIRFAVTDRSIEFSDGVVEKNVDSVVFCTGYLHSLPFLSSLNTGPDALITNGARVNRLFQHIFYIPDPTLSIVGLPIKVMPFPVGQAAAAVVARVWAKRLSLPSPAEMRDWERNQVIEKGDGKEFHYMNFPKDAEYLDLLGNLCEKAAGEGNCGRMRPTRWGEEQRWTRSRVPAIRKAFARCKMQGVIAKRKEDLGFDFDLGKEGFEATNLAD